MSVEYNVMEKDVEIVANRTNSLLTQLAQNHRIKIQPYLILFSGHDTAQYDASQFAALMNKLGHISTVHALEIKSFPFAFVVINNNPLIKISFFIKDEIITCHIVD